VCITRSKVVMLSVLSILALNGNPGEASVQLLSESTCPRLGPSLENLRLSLRSVQSPSEKSQGLFPRRREIVLELVTSDSSEEPLEIWTKEDYVDRPVPPLPVLVGSVICSDYGGDRVLDAMVLILKSDWKQDWQEGWFYFIRLPDGPGSGTVTWQGHVPRIPLPRGSIARSVSLHFYGITRLVGVLGTRYGTAPPILFVDPSAKIMTFYPSRAALRLGQLEEVAEEAPAGTFLDEFRREWRSCLSLEECGAEVDPCGNLVGVRHDSKGLFRLWLNGRRPECDGASSPQEGCSPNLACESGECTVLWQNEGSGSQCGG